MRKKKTMKKAKMLLIIKNVSIELAARIQKVIAEYDTERAKHEKRD